MREIHKFLEEHDKINLQYATNYLSTTTDAFRFELDVNQAELMFEKLPNTFVSDFKDKLDWNLLTVLYNFTDEEFYRYRKNINWCIYPVSKNVSGFKKFSTCLFGISRAPCPPNTNYGISYCNKSLDLLKIRIDKKVQPIEYVIYNLKHKIHFTVPCVATMIRKHFCVKNEFKCIAQIITNKCNPNDFSKAIVTLKYGYRQYRNLISKNLLELKV